MGHPVFSFKRQQRRIGVSALHVQDLKGGSDTTHITVLKFGDPLECFQASWAPLDGRGRPSPHELQKVCGVRITSVAEAAVHTRP